MRYLALAADYDGTLATNGLVDAPTVAGLQELLASGRSLILVTGRELDELLEIFPEIILFERVVAENGALLYYPKTREEKVLGVAPPPSFVTALRARGVPLSVGRSIVATVHPHETTVLEVIRDLGLELQVIFNKGAVMVLPAGVNKATGLKAALQDLGLSPHNVVGVGDGENDHALLSLCECSVAVANAVPMLKETADWMTMKDHGAGVVELAQAMIKNDLADLESGLARHHVLVGTRGARKEEVKISPYGHNLLLAGSSGSGKSTLAMGILERLAGQGYQFCIIDPEGDYESFEGAVALGTSHNAPSVEEVLQLLEKPDTNAVVNLVGLPLHDRPGFFVGLLPRLQELRAKTGRPHWILVDETHHLLPAGWDPAPLALSHALSNMMFITVHPDQVARAVLDDVDLVMALGEAPHDTLATFGTATGASIRIEPVELKPGQTLVWSKGGAGPFLVDIAPSKLDRRRHRRKYAEGELPPQRSFFFKGPQGALNLRAQNLILFMQMGEGVDDATWMHHLRQGDYSTWFREAIKDLALAEEVQGIESRSDVSPAESRRLVRAAIERHYTLPAQ
jgi:hydroxymethylpyrimidine pyrophosphatase-like HAD family hydrolase